MAQVKVITKRVAVPRTSIGSDGTFEDLSANSKGVLKYEVMSGASDVKNFRDGDDFYPFDGEGDSFRNEVFPQKDEFSYFSVFGIGKPSAKQKERQAARKERKAVKLDAKRAKAEETRSRAELNKGLSTDKQSDVELAKALQEKDGGGEQKKGLSTGAMIGIGAGALVLIIVVIVASRRGGSQGK